MNPAIPANHLAAVIAVLCGLIARHGHLRRLAGPLVVLVWQRVRNAGAQAAQALARMQAGTLRRHPHRRKPRPPAVPRRRTARAALPRQRAWLVRLIPETAVSAAHLQTLLAEPDMPALLAEAPQLRRALRPLCHMLGVALPPKPPQPPPPQPPAQQPPPTPAPIAPASRPAPATRRRPRVRPKPRANAAPQAMPKASPTQNNAARAKLTRAAIVPLRQCHRRQAV